MKRILFIFLICIIAFTSCKKDKKKDADCSVSEANLAGSYKISSIKYKLSETTPEVNFYDLYPREDCEKDDVTKFNADHTVGYIDAGVSCTPDNNDTGIWSLSGNVLTVDGDAGTLESFNCNGFNAIGTNIDQPGDKITVTYVRQ